MELWKGWGTRSCGGFGRGAFDEALRQAELRTQSTFAARHLALVRFVIVAREMEKAVEY
jgi:hypothetical protein